MKNYLRSKIEYYCKRNIFTILTVVCMLCCTSLIVKDIKKHINKPNISYKKK